MDFSQRPADPLLLRQAKVKKNIETDAMGDKVGRIHLGRQDLLEMQTRKMKGLKRGRDAFGGDQDEEPSGLDVDMTDEADSADERNDVVELKRQRLE